MSDGLSYPYLIIRVWMQALAQNAQLQRIANELADELHDKVCSVCVVLGLCVVQLAALQEMALAQQRATKELLANRITELEAEVMRLKGGLL